MLKTIKIPFITLFAFLLLINCKQEKKSIEKPDTDGIEILPEVVFDVVDDEPLQYFVESRGVVEPLQKVNISPRVSGFVDETNLVDGKYLQRGDLILQFDKEEWEYRLREAENEYIRTKNEYDIELRLRNGSTSGNGDQSNDFVKIQTGLAQAELNLERAKLDMSYTTIRAPFSGYISTKELISERAYIGAGRELGILVNTTKVRVRFDVLEREIFRLKTGMSVNLNDPSGESFTGNIIAVSPEIDRETKTGQVIVEVDNQEGKLKTGMTVEGRIFVESASGKVRMPRAALLERDGRTLVFKLNTNIVEWVYVTPEAMNRDWVIINHESINPGDTLAVDKHFSISHQQKIVPLMAN